MDSASTTEKRKPEARHPLWWIRSRCCGPTWPQTPYPPRLLRLAHWPIGQVF